VCHNAEVKQGFDQTQPLRQRYQNKDCHLRFDDLIQTPWLVITNLLQSKDVAVLDGIKPVKSSDCS